jgi:UDP-glucuronate 4-epimerase
MRVLVTGASGHIGAEVTKMLFNDGIQVLGMDSFTDFYSVEMKKKRIEDYEISEIIKFGDIADPDFLNNVFSSFSPTHVVNLAARAGVRSTWDQFGLYNHSNVVGFQKILETSKRFNVDHFIFASSSSVYGEGLTPPFKESAALPIPKSYYALTKVGNEIAAKAASEEIKSTALRFFTVYGPWGRPDMATLQFVAAGVLGRPATITGGMDIKRDFTHVRDAARCVVDTLGRSKGNNFEILNVSGGRPQSLADMLIILKEIGLNIRTSGGEISIMDVPLTHGSTEKLEIFDISVPQITLEQGLLEVVDWAKRIPTELLAKWVIPPAAK